MNLSDREDCADTAGGGRHDSLVFRIAAIATVLNAVGFIMAHRFLPLSDHPDWVYQGYVFSKMLRGAALPHYSIRPYPVPNSTLTLVLGLLDLAVAPELAGRIVLALSVVVFAAGATMLLKSLNRSERNPLLLLPLLYLFNAWFFWGEISYVLGMGLLFGCCAYLFRRMRTPESVSPGVLLAMSCALYLTHPIAYVAGALVAAVFVVTGPWRRIAVRFALAFAPSAAMLAWYLAARFSAGAGAGGGWVFWTPHLIAGRWLAAFSPFQQFLPWLSGELPVMKAAAVADLLASLAALALWPLCLAQWLRGRREHGAVLLAAALSLGAFAAGGFAVAGWVGPGERFLYPAAALALCWLGASSPPRRGSIGARAVTGAALALLLAQALFIDVYVGGVSQGLAAVYARLGAARSRAEFCEIYESYRALETPPAHRAGLDRLLTPHASVIRLPYYLFIQRDVPAPIFATGILRYEGPGDNENLCR
jgi:hypothetical protein